MDNVSINRLCAVWRGLACCSRFKSFVSKSDLQSFQKRSTAEGFEFFSRGLATARTALLGALESTYLDRLDGARLGKKRESVLPRFLYKAWSAIFTDGGRLRPDYDIEAIDCLNTLLGVFGKIAGAHTSESERRVLDNFVSLEMELKEFRIGPLWYKTMYHMRYERPSRPFADSIGAGVGCGIFHDRIAVWKVLSRARDYVCRVLANEDPRDIHPAHGSGSSACGTPFRKRFSNPRYIRAIDRIWPYSEFWYSGANHLVDELDLAAPTEELVPRAKVLLVPKDCRGPRLISCEPRETMWIQQGLMRKLVTCLESHKATRGFVNFTDQTINARLAKRASKTCSQATLDLKDASDRVTMELVNHLFPTNWADALAACRSGSTEMPDGTVVPLVKHAPMGSAVCFPVMALCIWAIAKAVIPGHRKVYVYGDDVIVDTDMAVTVMSALETFGLRVNRDKSFVHGPFKESCGCEAVDGTDITPVRLRMIPDETPEAKLKFIAFVNNCSHKFGVHQTLGLQLLVHEWYEGVPESKGTRHFFDAHRTPEYSGVLGVWQPDNDHVQRKWYRKLQKFRYRYQFAVPRKVKYPTDTWCCVLRSLVQPTGSSLGRDALSKRVRYKYDWRPLPGA